MRRTDRDPRDPDVDGHVDWIVFNRDWGTWSEPVDTIEDAADLSRRTGGGPIFERQWTQVQASE